MGLPLPELVAVMVLPPFGISRNKVEEEMEREGERDRSQKETRRVWYFRIANVSFLFVNATLAVYGVGREWTDWKRCLFLSRKSCSSVLLHEN